MKSPDNDQAARRVYVELDNDQAARLRKTLETIELDEEYIDDDFPPIGYIKEMFDKEFPFKPPYVYDKDNWFRRKRPQDEDEG